MVSACVIVPALDAAPTVGRVVAELRAALGAPIYVVDDGSTDATGRVASDAGAMVLRHELNRGKGEALRSGLAAAARGGYDVALSVDADGQHPAESAKAVLEGSGDPGALVLGVRDLAGDGAPRANQFGNAVSNFFVSRFAGRLLRDTQCGLRRYPVRATLGLGARASGFAFEAEVVLRAVASGLPVVEVPIRAVYPPPSSWRGRPTAPAGSHFRIPRDPARIIGTVLRTVSELRLRGR
ncbi:MAG: glycosyltransferase family 2 protein [Polyangiaceae bacterium]